MANLKLSMSITFITISAILLPLYGKPKYFLIKTVGTSGEKHSSKSDQSSEYISKYHEWISDISDYELEIDSIMKKSKEGYKNYEKILKQKKSSTLYISTNRESEALAEAERLHNAILYGLKRESCTAETKAKKLCKNKFSSDYFEDYDDDEESELKSKVNKFIKKSSSRFRGSSMAIGSKNTDGLCNPMRYTIPCDPDRRWRFINGTCNNIVNPHWGSKVILFPRFMNSTYEDGKFIPRGGWEGNQLPNPRFLSETLSHPKWPINKYFGQKHRRHRTYQDEESSDLFTHMTVSFGQFMGHDMTLTTESEHDCCDEEILEKQKLLPHPVRKCWNIDISKDKWFQKNNITCHPFTRSNFYICDKKSEIHGTHQLNGITSFIDGSAVYGEDIIKSKKLRQMKDGLLKTGSNETGPLIHRLPEAQECGFKSGSFFIEKYDTEVAGDTRAAMQPSLTSMHTLFMVEHNRIARELKKRLTNVTLPEGVDMDELLFQETRIIIIAEQQKITYNDYLHSVLGDEHWKDNKFATSNRSTYYPEAEASIRNEFATAAFRFGHSNVAGKWIPKSTDLYKKINRKIPEFYGNFTIPPFWPLRWHYFDTSLFVTSFYGEEWNEELYGTINQPCQKTDLHVTDDLTDYLFAKSFKDIPLNPDGTPTNTEFPAEDIVARNIQRGRDHGIPSYNQMRAFCNLTSLTSFKNIPKEISKSTWKELSKAYNTVDQIDLYLGGYAETTLENALVGPTFACIIEKQFDLLKRGDRFFFSHSKGLNNKGISDVLYEEIKERTLGDIMCANMNILENNGTQKDVFRLIDDDKNPVVTCKERRDINFDTVANDILKYYETYKQVPGPLWIRKSTAATTMTSFTTSTEAVINTTINTLTESLPRPLWTRKSTAATTMTSFTTSTEAVINTTINTLTESLNVTKLSAPLTLGSITRNINITTNSIRDINIINNSMHDINITTNSTGIESNYSDGI